ncbi:hypothetical protein OPIT5_08280 [Opitutaceae bacterium TAV5]|nr:hypothetical protein OPIT5_08280 [Opitutaceae bacterium TAV5]
MKTLIPLALLAAALLAAPGCSLLKHNSPQDAATTIRVTSPAGASYAVTIAKDTQFQNLSLRFGDIALAADSITGNASAPLAVAGENNAKAGAALGDTVKAAGAAIGDAAEGVATAVKEAVVK